MVRFVQSPKKFITSTSLQTGVVNAAKTARLRNLTDTSNFQGGLNVEILR